MGCTHSKKKKDPRTKETNTRAASPEKLYSPKEPQPSTTIPSSCENLVTPVAAKPPQFEETIEGEEKAKIAENGKPKVGNSQNTDTFQWPSAYEVKRAEKAPPGPLSPNQLAQWAARDKYAFLENRIQLKNKRKEESIEDFEEDDTLFELPTRMPNVDFSTERQTN